MASGSALGRLTRTHASRAASAARATPGLSGYSDGEKFVL